MHISGIDVIKSIAIQIHKGKTEHNWDAENIRGAAKILEDFTNVSETNTISSETTIEIINKYNSVEEITAALIAVARKSQGETIEIGAEFYLPDGTVVRNENKNPNEILRIAFDRGLITMKDKEAIILWENNLKIRELEEQIIKLKQELYMAAARFYPIDHISH